MKLFYIIYENVLNICFYFSFFIISKSVNFNPKVYFYLGPKKTPSCFESFDFDRPNSCFPVSDIKIEFKDPPIFKKVKATWYIDALDDEIFKEIKAKNPTPNSGSNPEILHLGGFEIKITNEQEKSSIIIFEDTKDGLVPNSSSIDMVETKKIERVLINNTFYYDDESRNQADISLGFPPDS